MEAEPDLSTLFTMCNDLPGYNEAWGYERRVLVAKILTCIIQRDHDLRIKIIESGRVKSILDLLKDTVSWDGWFS